MNNRKNGKRFYVTNYQRQEAERMAAKWEARAIAFYTGCNDENNSDGWGKSVAGYCRTFEEAERAEEMAKRIHDAINALIYGGACWQDVETVRNAVIDRQLISDMVV